MLCVICQDNAEEALGVACSGGGSERHFVCGECLEQYVRQESAEQDITRLSYREGHILCPLAPKSLSDTRNAHHLTCRNSVHYSPVTLQNLLTQQTYAQYTAALAKVAEQNGYVQSLSTASQQSQDDEHNAMLAEQIRRLMPDARQCHQCHHGPIDIYACSNLQTHHQQRISSSKSGRHSVINNSCPMCGWFSHTRHDWPKWNGKLVDGVSRPIERKKKPPLILVETFIVSFVLFAVLVYLWSVGDSVYYQDQFRLSWKIINTIFSPFGRILQFSWHHCVQHICGGFVTCLKGVECLIHAVTQVLMRVVRAVCSVMVDKILPCVWQSLASGAQVLMSVVRAVCSVMVDKILPYVWQSLASGAQAVLRVVRAVCSVMVHKILPYVWQSLTLSAQVLMSVVRAVCRVMVDKIFPYVWQSLTLSAQVLMRVVRAVCSVMVHKILPYVWQSLASGAQVLMRVVRAVCSVMVHKILPYVWQSLASGAQVLMSVVRAVCSVMVHKILPYVWQSLASGAQVLLRGGSVVCSIMVHKILPYVWQSLASGAQVLLRGGSVVCNVTAVSACKILPFVWQVFTSGTIWLGGIALQGVSAACSFTAFKILPYVWPSLTSMV
jgi:hypothetical protein